MWDQARQVLNSAIPATQWAMNAINNSVVKPFVKGYTTSPSEQNPQLEFKNNADLAQSFGNFAANATPEGGIGAMGAHALPAMAAALPIVGLGMKDISVIGKAMHPEDVAEMQPVLERYLGNDSLKYYQGLRNQDEQKIIANAGHYIGKEIIDKYSSQPVRIAQELLNRVMLDRNWIPK